MNALPMTPVNVLSKRFLIVDDDPLLSQFVVYYLSEKGHQCISLNDSTNVLAWLEENACDAVIMDINMPGIDGLTLVSMIRQAHKKLPIIMFTGLGYSEEKMTRALAVGANGYVSKALPPEEIYSALLRCIN